MGKSLIIAEKPSVAAQIAKTVGNCAKQTDCYEGTTAIVSYAFGHLVEMFSAEMEEAHFNDLASLPIIPERFSLRASKSGAKQLSALKKLVQRNDVDCVVNACDAGREGELIFRLIYQLIGCRKPIKRMWIKSMTNEGLKDSLKTMKDGRNYDCLDQAARSRAEADYVLGVNMTRAVSALKKAEVGQGSVSSCGRVQTPVLTLVVEREQEIRNFVPRDFWTVMGTFGLASGQYMGKWIEARTDNAQNGDDDKGRFYDVQKAQGILAKCRDATPTRVEDVAAISRQKPPKLFNQTELQRESNRRYKFTAQQTLDLTQALYEKHKLVSYPRTSSQQLPEGDVQDVIATISTAFKGTGYENFASLITNNNWVNGDNKAVFDDSKITDHFAIIPAPGARCNASALSDDEKKIYDLIIRRFLAVFFPHAEFSETKRYTHIAGEIFYTSGKVLNNPGWKVLYPKTDSDSQLCTLKPGENASNIGIELKASKTTPPSRYNPDTLLGAMQSAGKYVEDEALSAAMKGCGLGTDATRAGIIELLQKSKSASGNPIEPYMVCEGKRQEFVPTAKAIDLISFLKLNNISILTSPILTGEWESKLALMEDGKISKSEFMSEIASQTRHCIQIIKDKAVQVTGKPLVAISTSSAESLKGEVFACCPNCKGDIIKLIQPFVKFKCQKCSFSLSGMVCKRVMKDEEISQLIKTGSLEVKNGYVSKANKPFSMALGLDKKTGSLIFNFVN